MAAAGIGSIFGGFGSINWAFWGTLLLWGFVALLLGLLAGTALYIFIIKSAQMQVIELNLITKKIRRFPAVQKRNRSHNRQLYIKKLKKFLPNIQQEDIFNWKNKDTVLLLKDNNGMYHTGRLPSLKDIIKWFEVTEGHSYAEEIKAVEMMETPEERLTLIDKLKDKFKNTKRASEIDLLTTIFLQPNPMENLEWLADEQNKADQDFKTGLLKNPMVVWIGTLTILSILTIIWLIVMKMM